MVTPSRGPFINRPSDSGGGGTSESQEEEEDEQRRPTDGRDERTGGSASGPGGTGGTIDRPAGAGGDEPPSMDEVEDTADPGADVDEPPQTGPGITAQPPGRRPEGVPEAEPEGEVITEQERRRNLRAAEAGAVLDLEERLRQRGLDPDDFEIVRREEDGQVTFRVSRTDPAAAAAGILERRLEGRGIEADVSQADIEAMPEGGFRLTEEAVDRLERQQAAEELDARFEQVDIGAEDLERETAVVEPGETDGPTRTLPGGGVPVERFTVSEDVEQRIRADLEAQSPADIALGDRPSPQQAPEGIQEAERMVQRKREAQRIRDPVAAIEQRLEAETGKELTPGEDFTVTPVTQGVEGAIGVGGMFQVELTEEGQEKVAGREERLGEFTLFRIGGEPFEEKAREFAAGAAEVGGDITSGIARAELNLFERIGVDIPSETEERVIRQSRVPGEAPVRIFAESPVLFKEGIELAESARRRVLSPGATPATREEFSSDLSTAIETEIREIERAAEERPVETGLAVGSTLVGTGLAIRGATALGGPRAARGVAFTFQPGEEIASAGLTRAFPRVASKFPGGRIDNEEIVIAAAKKAAGRTRRAAGTSVTRAIAAAEGSRVSTGLERIRQTSLKDIENEVRLRAQRRRFGRPPVREIEPVTEAELREQDVVAVLDLRGEVEAEGRAEGDVEDDVGGVAAGGERVHVDVRQAGGGLLRAEMRTGVGEEFDLAANPRTEFEIEEEGVRRELGLEADVLSEELDAVAAAEGLEISRLTGGELLGEATRPSVEQRLRQQQIATARADVGLSTEVEFGLEAETELERETERRLEAMLEVEEEQETETEFEIEALTETEVETFLPDGDEPKRGRRGFDLDEFEKTFSGDVATPEEIFEGIEEDID